MTHKISRGDSLCHHNLISFKEIYYTCYTCILNVVHVFLLLSMYSYCCLCILIVLYVFLDAATVTEVFPCFFLGCKANARVILAKTGHGQHSSKIVVLFYVLFVLYRSMYCLCVNVYCHRVTTQLQLTNISYHISYLSFSDCNYLYVRAVPRK